MLSKIRYKLLLTYFIILIVAFLVTHFSYQVLSRRYVVSETHKQLKIEGQALAKILATAQLQQKDVFKRVAQRRTLRTAQNFVEADIIVLNKDGIPLYKSAPDINKQMLKALSEKDNSGHLNLISDRIPIYSKKNEIKGTIILFTKAKTVYGLNQLLRGAQLFSFFIAGIIALAIGAVLERSLTQPIYMLANKMKDFSVNHDTYGQDIKTGDEIQALDQSFKEMVLKVRQYDDMQKNLIQNTSHELKTPLMSIQGYAEAIKDGVVEGEEMENSLDIIIEQCQRLKYIVEEMIYLTKLENADEIFKLKRINLYEIIETAIKSVKPLADEKEIQINCDFSFQSLGMYDEGKLVRAFINILSNAIRYAQTQIDITAISKATTIHLMILDDGPGLARGEETKIFDRFYKGSKGNTGLGLAITKAIIEGHKGKITAANHIPNGAIIQIELPQS